jgi:centrosomal protein CEP72
LEVQSLQDQLEDNEKKNHQTQQFTKMLQEAHKSIVESNQHLLRDIDELRAKHESEALQWQKNFNEIKKLANFVNNNL